LKQLSATKTILRGNYIINNINFITSNANNTQARVRFGAQIVTKLYLDIRRFYP
jgi:hypothetical protein